jgi:hypothetical protein
MAKGGLTVLLPCRSSALQLHANRGGRKRAGWLAPKMTRGCFGINTLAQGGSSNEPDRWARERGGLAMTRDPVGKREAWLGRAFTAAFSR